MVFAYHLILSCYGFWLPNDPRGSWSQEVRRYELLRFGEATKVNTRRSVADKTHDSERRSAAKAALKHPPVRLTGQQARAMARRFAEAVKECSYDVFACVILREHMLFVIGRCERLIENISRHLKAKGTQHLNKEGLGYAYSPWAHGEWKVYLNNDYQIRRAIRYVWRNPMKDGLLPQNWSFVSPYEGTDAIRSKLRR